ncbi:MAG: endonuclease/exonuclease/phosphatase family protein [Pirellulales bacterium]
MATAASQTTDAAASGCCRRRLPPARIAVLLAALLVAGFVAAGYQRRPCDPASGTALSGEASPSPPGRTLRVGTFNIHSGRDQEGRFDLDRTAESLRELDLVGLNEVRGAFAWQEGNQAELLGAKLGLAWLFAPTERRFLRDDFGNGLLSNRPLICWRRLPLATVEGRGYRNAVLIELRHQSETIRVLLTHVDRGGDRSSHLATITDWYLSLPPPAILMGDLNTTAREPALVKLLAVPGIRDPLREARVKDRPERIDWILTRGLVTVRAGVRNNGASDHPAVWAELELPR